MREDSLVSFAVRLTGSLKVVGISAVGTMLPRGLWQHSADTPPPRDERRSPSDRVLAGIVLLLSAAVSPALAIDECGPGVGSENNKTITCDSTNYDPKTEGAILYVLSRPADDNTPHANARRQYTFNITGLKGSRTVTVDPNLDSYVDNKPAGIWITYSGTRHLAADLSDIELRAKEEITGKQGPKGIFLWLENHLGNRYTDGDHVNRNNPLYIDPRNLTLNVRNSEFHTYQEAVSAHSSWNGNITVNVRDTRIRTYTSTGNNVARLNYGSGIVGFHNAVGDVTINAERVDIVTRNGDGIYGGIWGGAGFPEPAYIGTATIDLNVNDSRIEVSGTQRGGVAAFHNGDIGVADISLRNSRVSAKGGAYGIAVYHGWMHGDITTFLNRTSGTATHKLDVRIKIYNSEVVTEDAHAIFIDRSRRISNHGTSIGKNVITIGSRVYAGGSSSYGIHAQGETDITLRGRLSAESGNAIKIKDGNLKLDVMGGKIDGSVTTDADHRSEICVVNRLIAEKPGGGSARIIGDGPFPSGVFDITANTITNGFNFSSRYAQRAAVYETLPGVLLRLEEPGAISSVRLESSDSPSWIQVFGNYGTYRPKSSSLGGRYSFRNHAVKAGMDFALRDDLTGWLSARIVTGSAGVSAPTGGGRIKATGFGPAAGVAWERGDGLYATGRASLTRYEVDYSSSSRGRLKDGANALALAIGLEAGQRDELSEKTHLTYRTWLNHSDISMKGFTDTVGSKVSLEDSDRLTVGIGLDAETETDFAEGESPVLLRGSIGVEQRIGGDRTRVRVFEERLNSKGLDTRFLLGASATWRAESYTLHGEVSSRGLGSDDKSYTASLTLRKDF